MRFPSESLSIAIFPQPFDIIFIGNLWIDSFAYPPCYLVNPFSADVIFNSHRVIGATLQNQLCNLFVSCLHHSESCPGSLTGRLNLLGENAQIFSPVSVRGLVIRCGPEGYYSSYLPNITKKLKNAIMNLG